MPWFWPTGVTAHEFDRLVRCMYREVYPMRSEYDAAAVGITTAGIREVIQNDRHGAPGMAGYVSEYRVV